ncbi:TlpA family protein disulfide reductase [Planctomicrobium sp. SH668]|uniref:TlpA family protein disulfide reductase n=1 Tax=Planctomicrobium sp. SH668 TaxID=3448126 RepID=UPI003F5ADF21
MKSLRIALLRKLLLIAVAGSVISAPAMISTLKADDPPSTEKKADEEKKEENLTVAEKIKNLQLSFRKSLQTIGQSKKPSEKFLALIAESNEILQETKDPAEIKALIQFQSVCINFIKQVEPQVAETAKSDLFEKIDGLGDPSLTQFAKIKFLEGELQSASAPSALNKLLEQNKELLDSASIEEKSNIVQIASSIASSNPNTDEAVATLKSLLPMVEGSESPIASRLKRGIEGTIRRIELPGNELELKIEKTFSGEDFDWKAHQGKVVLIDFWATWCGPCIREFPEMKKIYKAYHDSGFEIVGISIDADKADLEKFQEEWKLPWTILHDDRNLPNGEITNAAYYGVNSIPRMILVGRDFKVISTNARGKELKRLLKEQFPDITLPEDDKEAEKEPE